MSDSCCCIGGIVVGGVAALAFLANIIYFWEAPPTGYSHAQLTQSSCTEQAESHGTRKVLAVEMVNRVEPS